MKIDPMTSESSIQSLIGALNDRGLMPENLEVAKLGSVYFANAFDFLDQAVIHYSVCCGASRSLPMAVMKALSERIERRVFLETIQDCPETRFDSTDGFAAFPILISDDQLARQCARENAYSEAIERFVWAKWWDNPDLGAKVTRISASEPIDPVDEELLIEIDKVCALDSIWLIEPIVENPSVSPVILFGKLKDGGWISGGAAGVEASNVAFRAMIEMYRHAAAFKRMSRQNITPQSNYEKRLLFFASGQGDNLVETRLSANGRDSILLPRLEIDRHISHKDSDLFSVHHCLFEDQPVFLGGPIERFCL